MGMFDLTGRLAVVTGCRRGIGLAMAEALAGAGADIVGVSRQLEAEASEVQQRVEAAGRTFTGHCVDFADRVAVEQFASELGSGGRAVDILVNNAGTIARSAAVDHTDDAWDTVLDVNLTAPFVLTRELGKGMVERGSGKVIFTASLLSFQGGIRAPSYTAAKSGIAGLVRAFSNEWAGHGVNVNGIAPGYVETENTVALRQNAERFKQISERIPAGRWGTPRDLAGAAVFLCSPASDYVHGHILTVDGGWMGR